MLHVAAIQRAFSNPAVLAELDTFYVQLDQRIAEHRPVCRNRGACCKFDSFGHKLYVTTLELAYFRARHPDRLRDSTATAGASGSEHLCPFQREGLCTAREGRPVGCRVFFCESADEGWQSELTEWALGRLREMHERFDVPYAYTEWLAALAEMTASNSEASRGLKSEAR